MPERKRGVKLCITVSKNIDKILEEEAEKRDAHKLTYASILFSAMIKEKKRNNAFDDGFG